MAPEKAPAFQFYPKDFLTDERVGLMSYTERGIYITLLSKCWLEGSLPASVPALAKLLDIPIARFRKIWAGAVGQCFMPAAEGRISQKRLEIEREKQDNFRRKQSDKGKASAASRFNHGSTTVQPRPVQPEVNSSISSLLSSDSSHSTAPAPSKSIVTDEIAERAATLLDTYDRLYAQHRHGAKHFRRAPALHHSQACDLVRTWPDDRLVKMIEILLTTDDEWVQRTDRGFGVFVTRATWCDERLSAWEAAQKSRRPA